MVIKQLVMNEEYLGDGKRIFRDEHDFVMNK